jgi:TfoX N-terminal domain
MLIRTRSREETRAYLGVESPKTGKRRGA